MHELHQRHKKALRPGEINDRDLVENENANDEIEGGNYAFQIPLNMRAYGET